MDAEKEERSEQGQYLTYFLNTNFKSLQHQGPHRGHDSLGLAYFCGCFSALSHLLG